jgi:pimeloyl-ACP methyl ester carboxylesterase
MEEMEFDLVESGQGPAILMLPGSYATPAAWKGITNALKCPFRILSTSLPGYGTTSEVRPDENPDIDRLVEFVGQVVDAVGEPVHVVGHSWGAQLVLAAVLADRIRPLSVVCFEANPIFAHPSDGPFPWRNDIEAMVEHFEVALAEGNPDAASIIIDFYSRPGTFLAMPENVRAFCRATAKTNLRDWHSAATFTPPFKAFAAVDIPVTLVRGGQTPAPIVDVTRQLVANIPNANERVVAGADHFLISTHPAACAEVIEAHICDANR